MNARTGTRRGLAATGSTLFLATLLLAVAACRPAANEIIGKRVEIKWEERQLLFVGDPRTGIARVFHMRAAPLLVGEMRAPGRTAVHDIRIDKARERVWVLGSDALYAHDARTWSVLRRVQAPVADSARLELDSGGAPLLIGNDGLAIARVEPTHFTVEAFRLADSHPEKFAH